MSDKELLQQALEALESGLAFDRNAPLLAALRARLAREEEEPTTILYRNDGDTACEYWPKGVRLEPGDVIAVIRSKT